MRSTHRIIVAVALAVSTAAGTAAATRTVHLGADAKETTPISASTLAAQKAKLAAADRSIDRALAARPPALPGLPRFEPLGEPTVPPLILTRVISPSAAPAETGDDDAVSQPGSGRSHPAHRTPPAATPVSTRTPAPAHADDDDEDRHASGGDEDRAGDQGDDDSEHDAGRPEHDDD
jgi:hypothetical protein